EPEGVHLLYELGVALAAGVHVGEVVGGDAHEVAELLPDADAPDADGDPLAVAALVVAEGAPQGVERAGALVIAAAVELLAPVVAHEVGRGLVHGGVDDLALAGLEHAVVAGQGAAGGEEG